MTVAMPTLPGWQSLKYIRARNISHLFWNLPDLLWIFIDSSKNANNLLVLSPKFVATLENTFALPKA